MIVKRIGDADRIRTIEYLSAMFSKGYITQEEFGGRADVVAEAKTMTDIEPVIADLPALEDEKPAMPRTKNPLRLIWRKTSPGQRFLFLALFSLCVAICPSAYIARVSHGLGHASGAMVAVSVLTMTIGLGAAVISVIAAVIAWADDNDDTGW